MEVKVLQSLIRKSVKVSKSNSSLKNSHISDLFKDCPKVADYKFSIDNFLYKGYGFSTYLAQAPEIFSDIFNAGIGQSTLFDDIAGGFIKGSLKQPLSTAGIHDCVGINLVNEKTGKHALYHVFSGTSFEHIVKNIKENFGDFTGVNIIPGDNYHTVKTTGNVLTALKAVNPECKLKFYCLPSRNSEIVAQNGKLHVIFHRGAPKPTFAVNEKVCY